MFPPPPPRLAPTFKLPEVTGWHLSDREPIDTALGCLGVFEEHTADWQIVPEALREDEVSVPTIIVSPARINQHMHNLFSHAYNPHGMTAVEKAKYIDLFPVAMGSLVVDSLALSVAQLRSRNPRHVENYRRILRNTALGHTAFAASIFLATSYPQALLAGAISAGTNVAAIRYQNSPRVWANRAIADLEVQEPHIALRIGKAFLPTYKKVEAGSGY